MKKENLKAVVMQLIDMLDKNVINGNDCKPFIGWCEEGDVFYGKMSDEDAHECYEIMGHLAYSIDRLTEKIEEVA